MVIVRIIGLKVFAYFMYSQRALNFALGCAFVKFAIIKPIIDSRSKEEYSGQGTALIDSQNSLMMSHQKHHEPFNSMAIATTEAL